jgi:hypothetical protein
MNEITGKKIDKLPMSQKELQRRIEVIDFDIRVLQRKIDKLLVEKDLYEITLKSSLEYSERESA